MSQHKLEHGRGEEGLVPGARGALEEVGRGILGGEGEGGEGVHDHVDPQELHGGEGALGEQRAAQHGEDAGGAVDGELELKELADVVVHVSSPLDCLHDGGEVVIQDDYVCSVLRHLTMKISMSREEGGGRRE
eukprot:762480-Hanusia_phi.AAC.3